LRTARWRFPAARVRLRAAPRGAPLAWADIVGGGRVLFAALRFFLWGGWVNQ
jgi:hypothetical protein